MVTLTSVSVYRTEVIKWDLDPDITLWGRMNEPNRGRYEDNTCRQHGGRSLKAKAAYFLLFVA